MWSDIFRVFGAFVRKKDALLDSLRNHNATLLVHGIVRLTADFVLGAL